MTYTVMRIHASRNKGKTFVQTEQSNTINIKKQSKTNKQYLQIIQKKYIRGTNPLSQLQITRKG